MRCPGCGLDLGDEPRQAAPPPTQQAESDEDVVRGYRHLETLTTRQVCQLLQISDETLAQRILRGAVPLPFVRRPRRWRASEFFAWLDARPLVAIPSLGAGLHARPAGETRRSYFTRARAARRALRLVGER